MKRSIDNLFQAKAMMKTMQIHAEVLTPICIGNGRERDGLEFFIDEAAKKFCLIDTNWIQKALVEKESEYLNILGIIKQGDFKRLSEIKRTLWKDFFEVLQEWAIMPLAFKKLWQMGNSSNQGIVKQYITNPFTNQPILPGSTIKGILRTAYLFARVGYGEDRISLGENRGFNPLKVTNQSDVDEIENENKFNKDVDDLFKWIACEDMPWDQSQTVVQTFQSKQKERTFSPRWFNNKVKDWISLTVASLSKGEWTIKISELPNKIRKGETLSDIQEWIKDYSELMIERESHLFDGVNLNSQFINQLREYRDEGKYPIKVWMYKKSLTYKIWWEEMCEMLKLTGKERKKQALKIWVGDKTIYIDENGNPVGRILLSFEE